MQTWLLPLAKTRKSRLNFLANVCRKTQVYLRISSFRLTLIPTFKFCSLKTLKRRFLAVVSRTGCNHFVSRTQLSLQAKSNRQSSVIAHKCRNLTTLDLRTKKCSPWSHASTNTKIKTMTCESSLQKKISTFSMEIINKLTTKFKWLGKMLLLQRKLLSLALRMT